MIRYLFSIFSVSLTLVTFAQQAGTLLDPRDEQSYKTLTKDGITWMAQNLNYEMPGSFCYDDKIENCDDFGRLYTWEVAIQACPEGWHLASVEEWQQLAKWGGEGGYIDKIYEKTVSNPLKGFNALTRSDHKFNALLGGNMNDSQIFGSMKQYGLYWTSDSYDVGKARRVRLNGDAKKLYIGRAYGKGYAYSCRCVKD